MTWAEIQRSNCRAEIDSNNSTIRHYEQQYDSLRQFQSVVLESQGSFSTISDNKKKYLSDLRSGAPHCKTADRYCSGMDRVLNDVGVSYVSFTYTTLLSYIADKMQSYLTKIGDLEQDNRSLERRICQLDQQIHAEKENRRRQEEQRREK